MSPRRFEAGRGRRVAAVVLLAVAAGLPDRPLQAAARQPAAKEVVESRLLAPELRRQVAALAAARRPGGPVPDPRAAQWQAAATARQLLQGARRDGDPRRVGYARAALQPWWDREEVPADFGVMQATVEQTEHRFADARRRLERLLARHPGHLQGWLTLSGVRAVQGDLSAAREACGPVAAVAPSFGELCRLQVEVQTGTAEAALASLGQLARDADPVVAAWAASLQGETLSRLGRHEAAIAALQRAASAGELYDRLALADALLAAERPQAAALALRDAPPTDAVLLRRLRALPPGSPEAEALRELLRQRWVGVRGDEARLHARERALFALWTSAPPTEARDWAAANLALQREPIDLRIAAEAALRASDLALLDEVRRLQAASGLRDLRLQAALRSPAGRDTARLTP
ncbi:hypothetical protein OOT46_22405 [Aquabacterium sp. A7-Y]|uniref:hypothetical protein n=1 Tax=Aquabacterium sp. A7-Y TaxID=1349605 RepID=UPI00223DBCA3|nr:hypothetical protein [Aquabacterium sp. A7-Y]MCW7540580.1 hypothetical protein [Aquabacterium sp. A7-Y]